MGWVEQWSERSRELYGGLLAKKDPYVVDGFLSEPIWVELLISLLLFLFQMGELLREIKMALVGTDCLRMFYESEKNKLNL